MRKNASFFFSTPKLRDFLDGLLRGKWGAMKGELGNKDVSKELDFFLDSSREIYEQAFNVIIDKFPQMISNMQDIELIFLSDNVAKYKINRVHDIDGKSLTIIYYIYFVRETFSGKSSKKVDTGILGEMFKKGVVVELMKLKAKEERGMNIPGCIDDVGAEKLPLFYELINQK